MGEATDGPGSRGRTGELGAESHPALMWAGLRGSILFCADGVPEQQTSKRSVELASLNGRDTLFT